LSSIKPYVIKDAIENGLLHGYCIEYHDIITPYCDKLYEKAKNLNKLPISPIHPIIYQEDISSEAYVSGNVLFKYSNIEFINEWLSFCIKQKNYEKNDENIVLNILYRKHKCNEHLAIINPWYECFYDNIEYRYSACSFYGCKDPILQRKLLNDLIEYYSLKNNKIDIVIINLESRPDRLDKIQNNFNKYDYINLIRFNAYDKNINNTVNCGLSHYYAFIKYIIEDKKDFVIIMEDDNKPIEYFDILFPKVYIYLKNNLDKWDYINLSSSSVNCFGWKTPSLDLIKDFYDDNIPINSGLYNTINTSAANFVVYNKSMIKYFERYLLNIKYESSSYDKWIHIDQFFGNTDDTPDLKRVVLYPLISIQEKSISDISKCEVDYENLFSDTNTIMNNYLDNKYKYITINLKGGLGNQLFQIYACMAFSIKYNKVFILEDKIYSSVYPDTIRYTYYQTLIKEIQLYNNTEKIKWILVDDKNIDNENNYMVEGYYQDYNIFEEYSKEINNKLNIKYKIDKCYYKYLPDYDFSGIACHFRLGDYKGKKDDHPILDLEYYTKCFDMFDIKYKSITIFCEMEDVEYLQNKLNIYNIKFISNDIPDYEQLLLMSKFKDIIISNSSFSWWSGYFASSIYDNNNIYIPYKWFHNETCSNLIYKNWNVIRW
jgi:hypothetical protein